MELLNNISIFPLHIPNAFNIMCNGMNIHEINSLQDSNKDINIDILIGLWINFRLTDNLALKSFPNISHLKLELTSEQLLKYKPIYDQLTLFYYKLLGVNKGRIIIFSNIKDDDGLIISKDDDKFLLADITLDRPTYTLFLDVFSEISKETKYYGKQYLITLWN